MGEKESNQDDEDDQTQQINKKKDEQVLKFMDSLHSYLLLIDSLSSTLAQGWFDFASARYSMGASRVNCALLDLKEHAAATSLEVRGEEEPHFILHKWTKGSDEEAREKKDSAPDLQDCNNIRQRHKSISQVSEAEESSPVGGISDMADDRVQKERSKSLAVFGKLVSPKLRGAQGSFETALERVVEIANVRASMLSAFDQVKEISADEANNQ